MPFARPTIAELITRTRADLRGELEIDGPILRRAVVDVVAASWAGVVHGAYGFIDWASRQLFGATAERDALLRKAAPYDVTPTPATFASGNAIATGTNGSAILVDTILRLDEVNSYRVTVGQVIAGGTATLPVVAVIAGVAANLPATTPLSFESPIAGVNAVATVDVGGIDGGFDEEGTEELRDRYFLRLREPPEGGADQDYRAWVLAVPGVTRAWTYPNELGLGTVVVRFVMDGLPDIIPDAPSVAAAQAKLNAERPITAAPTAAAPTKLAIAHTVHLVPDTADTRAAVEAELADLFARVAEPGDGAGRGKVLLSQIRTAIGVAAGVTDYVLTVPAADVVPGVGELVVLGVPTWA